MYEYQNKYRILQYFATLSPTAEPPAIGPIRQKSDRDKHTSAGLSINENADPDVRNDLGAIFDRLVSEREAYYTHTLEGDDDMPAHAKSTLTGVELTIPVTRGRLNLGTWQGIYLCEFRNRAPGRRIVATIIA